TAKPLVPGGEPELEIPTLVGAAEWLHQIHLDHRETEEVDTPTGPGAVYRASIRPVVATTIGIGETQRAAAVPGHACVAEEEHSDRERAVVSAAQPEQSE